MTQTAVTQGQENMRLNEERYKEQVGTATDVIDAETLLTRTRVNYYTALYGPPDGQGRTAVGHGGHQRSSPPGQAAACTVTSSSG